MDYAASKKTTFGFVLTGNINPSDFKSNSDVYITDANKNPLSRTLANSGNDTKWKTMIFKVYLCDYQSIMISYL